MNKQALVSCAVALAIVALMMAPVARAEEKAPACPVAKAEKVTLTGKLSCTFCTLAHPEKACKKECCVACVKAGDPPSLKDAEGNVYLLLSGEKAMPLMTAEKMELMGKQVTVTGMKVACKGLQAIYVESMVKAEDKK
jgi:hypothetical protein